MNIALNEIEATGKKAARGAGYGWGMAEEAGKAARWLCGQGLDGTGALVALLTQVDGADLNAMAPARLQGDWICASGTMCPLMAGAALSDTALDWPDRGVSIDAVLTPVLLLPFAALAARRRGAAVSVDWPGLRAVVDQAEAWLDPATGAPLLETAGRVTIRAGGVPGQPLARKSRAHPRKGDWDALNRFAQRTYAPDTEESRLRGAGAGLSDND